jgi:DNA-binding MarR family transcriptional regulator
MKQNIVDDLLVQWARERPGIDVSALGIIVRIQVLAKLQQQSTAAALKRHGLKHWEYDVLSVLRRQGAPFEMPATDIAEAAMLTSGAMTTRIDGLEERGLVTRRRSRSDRRSMLVRLTERGKALVDEAIKTRLENANELLAEIPAADRKTLAALLRRLIPEATD